jgi:hypothetical protein
MSQDIPKTDILLSALSERYEALRVIRERVQTVGLTIIGLMLAAGGWLIQSDKQFSCKEQLVLTFGVLAAVGVFCTIYLADLRSGFKAQQRVAATIEKALGLYTPGAFESNPESIYPESWSRAGQEGGPGGFFAATTWMIFVGTAFLIVTIWVSS